MKMQYARQHLQSCQQSTRSLAVDVEQNRVIACGGDLFGAAHCDLRVLELNVLAAVNFRHAPKRLPTTDVFKQQDIEIAVVEFGLRRKVHIAAGELAIADADQANGRRQKYKGAAQAPRPAGVVDAMVNFAAHAKTGDVIEIAEAGRTVIGNVIQSPGIDDVAPAVFERGDIAGQIFGAAGGAAKVVAGATHNERQFDMRVKRLVVGQHAIDAFVDGAVAADGNDPVVAFGNCGARKGDRSTGAFCKAHMNGPNGGFDLSLDG